MWDKIKTWTHTDGGKATIIVGVLVMLYLAYRYFHPSNPKTATVLEPTAKDSGDIPNESSAESGDISGETGANTSDLTDADIQAMIDDELTSFENRLMLQTQNGIAANGSNPSNSNLTALPKTETPQMSQRMSGQQQGLTVGTTQPNTFTVNGDWINETYVGNDGKTYSERIPATQGNVTALTKSGYKQETVDEYGSSSQQTQPLTFG